MSTAVAATGTTAYTGIGSTLLVVDVSDPTRPIERGGVNLSDQVVQMQLAGDLLFVACGDGGLQIVDVSNSDHPVRIGEYAGAVYSIAVRDARAYVLGEHFSVLDVSDPASPALLGQSDEPAVSGFYPEDLAISGDFAFVSGSEEGLLVYDISNPAAPVHVATHDVNPGMEIRGIEIVGNQLYATAWYGRLLILDVSNPLKLELLSSTHLGEPDTNFFPSRLAIQNDRAFVVGGDGLAVLDVTNPLLPVALSLSYVGVDGIDVAVFDHGIAVAGGRDGLLLFQAQSAEQWTSVGRLDEAGWIYAAAATGGYAYVDRLGDEAATLDLRDPALPRLLRTLPQLSGTAATVVDGRLYTGGARVNVFDLIHPETPTRRGTFDPTMFVRWVDVSESLVFAAGDRGLDGFDAAIIDVANPAAPRLLSQIQAFDEVEAAGLNGATWYFSTPSGLQVFDVTDPTEPQSLGVFPDIRFRDIAFSGGIAFVAGYAMQTLDVSNPSTPTVLHNWSAQSSRFRQLALAGAFVIVGPSVHSGGAAIFHVADPLDPQLLVMYDRLSGPLCVVDNLAMLLDDSRGMTIVRFGDQADLNLDARVDLTDLATLLIHFGTSGSVGRPDGDLNGDAQVGLADLQQMLVHYGAACD